MTFAFRRKIYHLFKFGLSCELWEDRIIARFTRQFNFWVMWGRLHSPAKHQSTHIAVFIIRFVSRQFVCVCLPRIRAWMRCGFGHVLSFFIDFVKRIMMSNTLLFECIHRIIHLTYGMITIFSRIFSSFIILKIHNLLQRIECIFIPLEHRKKV